MTLDEQIMWAQQKYTETAYETYREVSASLWELKEARLNKQTATDVWENDLLARSNPPVVHHYHHYPPQQFNTPYIDTSKPH